MKRHQFAITLSFIFVLLVVSIHAQVDEVGDDGGLMLPIGQPAIYGQVSIEGLPKDERRPSIFVSLLISGTQIDRRPTDARGYFYFLQRPRHGHTLVFEVDGGEVGRAYLTVGSGTRLRQDVTLQWSSLKGQKSDPGVVSAKGYNRTPEAEKAFSAAMTLIRENKSDKAKLAFEEIVKNDPNDYVAWTMLGTIFFDQKKYSEGETAFNKALQLKPDYTLARVNLGKMYITQSEFDKAIATLQKGVELDATSADANHYLGEAYLSIKKGSLAVGYLNKAIELAPTQKADIHLRLATLYNAAGLKDRAAAEYKAFLSKVPNHADAKKFEQYIKENSPAKQ
ncbi:MAG: tetratricopeptide repeat protein [Pyrinomonadaceae bacterium]